MEITSNIIFLGTGGDSYVVGKQHRGSGGIILQIGGDQFHIDPGPGALLMARQAGVNLHANTGVFVTHNHINHANDVNAVIDAMTYGGFDKKGVLAANKTVLEGTDEHHPYLHPSYKEYVERVISLDTGKRVGINNVEVVALGARHDDPHALGLKFIAPDFTLTYTGDTQFHSNLVSEYAKSDILILNVPYLSSDEGKYNLCKEDAIKIINIVNPKLAIITHFGINFLKADPLYEVREIQKKTNVQVISAKDLMVVNPLSYAVEQGQKTLYKYASNEGVHVQEYRNDHSEQVSELDSMLHEKQTTLDSDQERDNSIPEKTSGT